jgi:hypothetical protein
MQKELERFSPHYEMNEINKTLKLIFRVERETLLNGNDSSLKRLDDEVLEMLVDYWYNYKEKVIFINENGEEIDEFLNVEEYKF